VVVTQDPSASAVYSPTTCFTGQDLQIIEHAAIILNCPLHQLLELDRNPRRRLSSQPTAYPTPKRLCVGTDLSPMSSSSNQDKTPTGLPSDERPEHHPGEKPGDVVTAGFSFGIKGGSRLASYLTAASVSLCPPCSPCTSCDPPGSSCLRVLSIFRTTCTDRSPQGYSTIATTAYDYETKPPPFSERIPPAMQVWAVPHSQPPPGSGLGPFPYDESPQSQLLPEYPVLQPTHAQPNTRSEEMTYPVPAPERKYHGHLNSMPDSRAESHVPEDYRRPSYVSPTEPAVPYGPNPGHLRVDGNGTRAPHQPSNLDIVSNNHRPPPAKRGPFKSNAEREQTAETRRIGSCIRCRMQRIRVSFEPTRPKT
jgi:hypothetical protein